MRQKLPELRVERIFLTGWDSGGELFFIGRAAEIRRRCAERGGDDPELLGAGLGFAGFPILANGWRAAKTACDGRFCDAGLADQRFKSAINEQNRHPAVVQNRESYKNKTKSP